MYIIQAIYLFIVYNTVSSQKDRFDKNCLESHNIYRAKHGAPPLVWSDSLAAAAQKWADTLAKRDEFKHDTVSIQKENQGENLAYFTPSRPKCMGEKRPDCVQCAEMVTDWYNEVKDYDFMTGAGKTKKSVVTHFTQVVWKATKELGVGTSLASNSTYGFITVARYSPRGNLSPSFKANVLPEGSSTTPKASVSPVTNTETPNKPTQGSSTTVEKPSEGNTNKMPGEDCEFFIITTVTKERKIIQKCKGKPNVTFIAEQSKSVSTSKPFSLGTETQPTTKPATTAAMVSSGEASTSKSQPTTASPPELSRTPTHASSTVGSSSQPKVTSNPTSHQPPSATSTLTTNKAGTTISQNEPLEDKQDEALILSNIYRRMHGAQPLIESTTLKEEAQKWAEHLAEEEQLVHDPSTTDGENIAAVKVNSNDIENTINTWYDESKQYDYTAPAFSKSTGHFTQLVWKSSKEFGVGIALSKDRSRYYVVARFRPSGNIQNKFGENVGLKEIR